MACNKLAPYLATSTLASGREPAKKMVEAYYSSRNNYSYKGCTAYRDSWKRKRTLTASTWPLRTTGTPAFPLPPCLAEHARLVMSTELAEERLGDDGGVEESRRGAELRVVEDALMFGQCPYRITTNLRSDTGAVSTDPASDIDRLTAEKAGNAADLPSRARLSYQGVGDISEKGQFIDVTGLKDILGACPRIELNGVGA